MKFLENLRRQPEYIRKIILWAIVGGIGLGLLVWWFHSSYSKIKNFPKEELIKKINLPDFRGELPKIEIPEAAKEELERLEKEMDKNREEPQNENLNDK